LGSKSPTKEEEEGQFMKYKLLHVISRIQEMVVGRLKAYYMKPYYM
jgi:hypothetical protein